VSLALVHCGGDPNDMGDASAFDVGVVQDAASPSDRPPASDAAMPQGADAGGVRRTPVPYIDGEFTRVYAPPNGRYLNDHTLVQAPSGGWHLYGITHESPGKPFAERQLLHATASSLLGPWTPQRDVLTAVGDEQVLWAPHVFARAPGAWTMYYWAGSSETMQPYRRGLRRADSTDLVNYTRVDAPATGGRDAFVLREGDRWLMYSVGVSASNLGQIVASSSTDLRVWTDPVVVLEDPVPSFGWGNVESPSVVRYDGAWYLFVTRTSKAHIDYVRTVVFRSDDPTRFAWRPLTDIRAHAAEVLVIDGRWWITSSGWTVRVGESNRGLSVAPLGWTQ